jgi:hypothetical protein
MRLVSALSIPATARSAVTRDFSLTETGLKGNILLSSKTAVFHKIIDITAIRVYIVSIR